MSRAFGLKSAAASLAAGFYLPAAGLPPAKAVESLKPRATTMNLNHHRTPSPRMAAGRSEPPKLPPSSTDRGSAARMPLAVENQPVRGAFSKRNEEPVPQQPLQAIRAKCVDCSGGSLAKVRECAATSCALWPFRMGTNPNRRRAAE